MKRGVRLMQKIKPIVMDALLYFFQIVVWFWPSFIVGNLIVGMLVRVAMNNSNEFVAVIFETVTSVLVLCAGLFLFAYRRGHKRAEFHYKKLLLSMILAFGLQLIYAVVLRFNVYTIAGAYFLAYLFCPHTSADDIPAYVDIICMCIVYVFYIAAVLWGEYLGKKKRLAERSVLNLDETT